MLSKLLHALQYCDTPLHQAASGGHATCVECLLPTPGIDVNIKDKVSCSILYVHMYNVCTVTQKLYRAKIVPACTLFATKIVPPGTILVAKSVPALPKVYRVVRKYR